MINWYKKQGVTIRAAIIGGGFAILAGIITGVIELMVPNPPIVVEYLPITLSSSSTNLPVTIISTTHVNLPKLGPIGSRKNQAFLAANW